MNKTELINKMCWDYRLELEALTYEEIKAQYDQVAHLHKMDWSLMYEDFLNRGGKNVTNSYNKTDLSEAEEFCDRIARLV
jgi:hypothetical protein